MTASVDLDPTALRDAVDRVLREHRDDVDTTRVWRALGEVGALGLRVPAAWGGLEAGAAATAVVMEALGATPVPGPYVASAVVGATLIGALADERQAAQWLPAMAEGRLRVALTCVEPMATLPASAGVTASAGADGSWLLNGVASPVVDGAAVDGYIVVARGEGVPVQGTTLFLVPAETPGLRRRTAPTFDGRDAARLEFDACAVRAQAVLGGVGRGADPLARAVREACVALCAESVGAMQAMLDLSLAHLRSRRQFGVALASFQVLQHRAVDMLIALEQARSITRLAAQRIDEGDEAAAQRACAAAKALVGRNATFVGQQAVQLHGGMGMTEACDVGRYFKRVTANDLLYGSADHHLQHLAVGGGLQPLDMGLNT